MGVVVDGRKKREWRNAWEEVEKEGLRDEELLNVEELQHGSYDGVKEEEVDGGMTREWRNV